MERQGRTKKVRNSIWRGILPGDRGRVITTLSGHRLWGIQNPSEILYHLLPASPAEGKFKPVQVNKRQAYGPFLGTLMRTIPLSSPNHWCGSETPDFLCRNNRQCWLLPLSSDPSQNFLQSQLSSNKAKQKVPSNSYVAFCRLNLSPTVWPWLNAFNGQGEGKRPQGSKESPWKPDRLLPLTHELFKDTTEILHKSQNTWANIPGHVPDTGEEMYLY